MRQGKITLRETIATMEPGESWLVPSDVALTANLRAYCSRFGASTGSFFSVKKTQDGATLVIRNF